jgi:murein tripeptide amidase MpaA
LSDSEEAKMLRKHYVFKIVPMLNPDGVAYGNYRCSLLGVDLNRRWMSPNRLLHPTIHTTKLMIKLFAEERKVAMFCDMHGHSRKMNSFTYGCTYKGYENEGRRRNALLRLIPLLLSYKNKSFAFKDS